MNRIGVSGNTSIETDIGFELVRGLISRTVNAASEDGHYYPTGPAKVVDANDYVFLCTDRGSTIQVSSDCLVDLAVKHKRAGDLEHGDLIMINLNGKISIEPLRAISPGTVTLPFYEFTEPVNRFLYCNGFGIRYEED